MKQVKRIVLLLLVFSLMMMPMSVLAAVNPNTISASTTIKTLFGTGYTSDGIYYEVYDITTGTDSATPNAIVTLHVRRCVLYYAIVTPPSSIPWSEKTSAGNMYGTLYFNLAVYNYTENTTEAWFEGDITGSI